MKNRGAKLKINKSLELGECACFSFRKASRVITQIFDKILRPSGLRTTQFTILIMTHSATTSDPSVNIVRLAQILVMERTTLTRNLKLLENKGLLRIDQGEDHRKRIITLTKKGHEALERTLPLWKKAQFYVVERLGQERWRDILGHLSSILELARNK